MNTAIPQNDRSPIIQSGIVTQNRKVCRDHFRMTIALPELAKAKPGQFVHLCPEVNESPGYGVAEEPWKDYHGPWWNELSAPMLRRAFSIADLVRHADRVEIDVIYRVVGTATRWLSSLTMGDSISVMGPLGVEFPISAERPDAWLVAGGVGLPPLLWLANALQEQGKRTVAFCGAQSRDLLALEIDAEQPPATDASHATMSATEFAQTGALTVISTDDGSMGFRGHIGAAMEAYARANRPDSRRLVVYTCGPERMMRFVAKFCAQRNIECYVCVERNMACGTGMCQSCIVPVRDESDSAGWRYRLCCTDGPIFEASQVIWE